MQNLVFLFILSTSIMKNYSNNNFKIGDIYFVYPDLNQIVICRKASSRIKEKVIKLEPRFMHVLTLLAKEPNALLSREFLIRTVWENSYVGEEALTQAISRLRKLLGDDALQPKVIQTIPKKGYRLLADVTTLPDNESFIARTLQTSTKGMTSKSRSKGLVVFGLAGISVVILLMASLRFGKTSVTGLETVDVTTSSMEAYKVYKEGRDSYRQFLWGRAKVNFEQAVQLDSGFASAYYHLAKTYARLRDQEGQLRAIKSAMRLADQVTEKEALNIRSYFAWEVEKDTEKGFRLAEELVRKYPEEGQTIFELALQYRRNGRLEEAIAANEKALELNPQWGEVYNELGYEHAFLGQFNKAEDYFLRYAALTRGEANAFDSLGDLYFMTGRLEDAIVNYELAVETTGRYLSSASQLAFVHALKEDYSQALQWLDEVINSHTQPGWLAVAHRSKGLILLYLGRQEEALNQFQLQMDLVGKIGDELGKSEAFELSSFVHVAVGRFNLAAEALEKSLKARLREEPENGARWRSLYEFLMGLVDIQTGNLVVAEERLEKVRRLRPRLNHNWSDFAAYWLGIFEGELLLAKGHASEAIRVFENINFPQPYYLNWHWFSTYRKPLPRDGLARAYVANGDIDGAIREYERLLHFDPAAKSRFLINPIYHSRLASLYEKNDQLNLAHQEDKKFVNIVNSYPSSVISDQ